MSPHQATLAKFIAKIERWNSLSEPARTSLFDLPTKIRRFTTYQDIVREGARPTECCMIYSGLVSRYRTLRNGSRQILSFHISGDMVDLQSALVVVADHGIRTHEPTTVIAVSHRDILEVADNHPDVARALWFDTLVNAATFREWTVNVGRRNARERTAHLLLEFAARFEAVGMVKDGTFVLPISQNDLADALGMTPVHMNRTMQWLRGERLIRTHMRTITIEDMPAMAELAGFDPTYLHPEGPRQPATVPA